MTDTIADLRFNLVRVSGKTIWIFVRLRTKDGLEGIGEATLARHEASVAAYLAAARSWLVGYPAGDINGIQQRLTGLGGVPQCAARAGIEQALWDILGKRTGLPLHALLGGALRHEIPMYANINRRTEKRAPEGFAESASLARDDGHRIVKMAPFDNLKFDDGWDAGKLYDHGLRCLRAAVEAMGDDGNVAVDCHWRMGGGLAEKLLYEAADLNLFWVECALPETPEAMDDLIRLRGLGHQLRVRLAGLEQCTSLREFLPFLRAGVFDVVMPDVKWVGGVGPVRDIAAAADAHGVATSPHNPTGPVAHAASLHLVSTLPRTVPLEHQYDESPLFQDLCPGQVPAITKGVSALPQGPGLGVTLDDGVLAETSIDPADLA